MQHVAESPFFIFFHPPPKLCPRVQTAPPMTSRGRGRGTQSSSRGARAPRKDGQARAETHATVRHRHLDEEKEERLVRDIAESLSRRELSPFLGELESPQPSNLSKKGAGVTAHDILEAQRMYGERDGDFRMGIDVEADPHGHADLRRPRPHHANRQVSSHDFQWVDGMSRNLFPAQCCPFAPQR